MSNVRTTGKFKTARGFRGFAWKDGHGQECSLQESSIATESAIWLGCDSGTHFDKETIRVVDVDVDCLSRMHLNRTMVKTLIRRLQKWLDTDSLK